MNKKESIIIFPELTKNTDNNPRALIIVTDRNTVRVAKRQYEII